MCKSITEFSKDVRSIMRVPPAEYLSFMKRPSNFIDATQKRFVKLVLVQVSARSINTAKLKQKIDFYIRFN